MAEEDWQSLERFAFGDGPALADALLELVLAGRKTATCWADVEGQKTSVGQRWVVEDGAGRPRAVIETVSLAQVRFEEVDDRFAFDEGEDDRSLAAWRREHETYFRRLGQFAPGMLLWCERFRLVAVIDDAGVATPAS